MYNITQELTQYILWLLLSLLVKDRIMRHNASFYTSFVHNLKICNELFARNIFLASAKNEVAKNQTNSREY